MVTGDVLPGRGLVPTGRLPEGGHAPRPPLRTADGQSEDCQLGELTYSPSPPSSLHRGLLTIPPSQGPNSLRSEKLQHLWEAFNYFRLYDRIELLSGVTGPGLRGRADGTLLMRTRKFASRTRR